MDTRQAEAEQRYISSEITLRGLAEESGVPLSTLCKWSKAGGWKKKREKFQKRAMRKAVTRATDKRARELQKLIEASGEMEEALLTAARAFRAQLMADETGEKLTDGKNRAANLSSVAHAIGRQAETRMLLSGILSQADQEKLELLRRRQELEEKKAQAEQETGAAEVRLILEPEMEDLLNGENGGDSDALPEPAAAIIPAKR